MGNKIFSVYDDILSAGEKFAIESKQDTIIAHLATIASATSLTGISNGRTVVTTAGTRVALAASTACKRITITAETDNTGAVVVGGSTVVAALATRQGVPLFAGDVFELDIDNLADVYLDSTVSGEGVTYSYFTG